MQFGAFRVPLNAATVTTGGAALAVKNPEEVDVIITRAVLWVKTPSGAATVDIGIANNATTSNDGLLDGISTAAAGVFGNIGNAGTNGKATALWGANQYVTATASATLAGLEAYLYIDYLRTV